jgi:hypothetical protein
VAGFADLFFYSTFKCGSVRVFASLSVFVRVPAGCVGTFLAKVRVVCTHASD